MIEKRPKSFVLYGDFEAALLQLSMRERGILFTMIYSYANRGCIDEFLKRTPLVDVTFQIIRAQLDRDMKKYEQICIRNSENGKFGGRPRKKTETQKTQSVFEKPRKPYNNNNNKNNSNNNTYNNNNSMRSFDPDDFFAAALARSYGETENEETEKKDIT